MQIFKSKVELQKHLSKLVNEKTIGFVPTMGALHSGHLQLISESKQECDITICSIFVNPTQFNNSEDLANYPKTIDSDLEQLNQLACDIVYTPTANDLYKKDEKAKEFDFGSLASSMEGEFRPGHFNGMATIVEKFFNIVTPTKAFFGEKDLQQLQIVRELVKQTNSPINIIGVPTIREQNGLAKSSRNKLLSEEAKQEAALIYNCLQYCKQNKNLGVDKLKAEVKDRFYNSNKIELEYVKFVNLNTMQDN